MAFLASGGDGRKASACLACDIVCKRGARVAPYALALPASAIPTFSSTMSTAMVASSLEVPDGGDVELGGKLHRRWWGSGCIHKCRDLLRHRLLVGGQLVDGGHN
jgi:hypothetical protein